MKLCLVCLRCYEDDEASCLNDQSTLVPSRHGTRMIADKYRLDRLLGRGGMGAVYLGTHVDLDRLVAIKLLLPDFTADTDALERFRREARAAARLNHPNVADTYDYGVLPDGGAYIVMEMVEGQTLREYMDAAGPLPLEEAVNIAEQVADGIAAAHRSEIIHRDLKPSNIILTRDHLGKLQAKVVDFGVAKLKEQTTTSGGLTASGSLIGTPRYMSPEQCAGLKTDARSDLYSMGVILYEMLAGHPPFDAPSATAVAIKHIQAEPPPLSEFRSNIPVEIEQFVKQALDKDPARRQQSASDFSQRLREIADSVLHKDAAPDPNTQPGKQTERQSREKATSDGREKNTFSAPSKNTDRGGFPTAEHFPEFQEQKDPSVIGFNAQPAEVMTETATKIAEPPAPDDAAHLRDKFEVPEAGILQPSETAASTTIPTQKRRRTWPLIAIVSALLVIIAIAIWFALKGANQQNPNQSANNSPRLEDNAQAKPGSSATDSSTQEVKTPLNQTNIDSNSNTELNDKSAKADPSVELRTALEEWVAATNIRDLNKQMTYYAPVLTTFYTKHGVPLSAVRAEKGRLFAQINSINVRTTAPEIRFASDGQSATMRFRKSWNTTGMQSQSGEVVQELIWKKFDARWKITSERDVEVIRVTQ
jgi:serine/threonine protein kinase